MKYDKAHQPTLSELIDVYGLTISGTRQNGTLIHPQDKSRAILDVSLQKGKIDMISFRSFLFQDGDQEGKEMLQILSALLEGNYVYIRKKRLFSRSWVTSIEVYTNEFTVREKEDCTNCPDIDISAPIKPFAKTIHS